MNKFEKISFGQFVTDFKANKYYVITDEYEAWDDGAADYVDLGDIYREMELPERATGRSAGYDIRLPVGITIPAGWQVDCLTGLKVAINDDCVLLIVPRSSMGIKHGLVLANTVGVIDADYHNNPVNEGHIHLVLKNNSERNITIAAGTRVAQGIFVHYGITDDDSAHGIREGGIGSTGV